MAIWIQLTRPAGDPDNVNADQICYYNEAYKGGTYIQFSDGKDARIYQESPIEVKRMIKAQRPPGTP